MAKLSKDGPLVVGLFALIVTETLDNKLIQGGCEQVGSNLINYNKEMKWDYLWC